MLKLFIEKPVLACALSLFIILIGIASYFMLPVRDYPLLPATQVTISTSYAGASPQVMEGFISTPILKSLSGLDGVDYISSQNQQSQSTITVNFKIGFNVDSVLAQISNRVNAIKWQFPKGINGPSIQKLNPNQSPTAGIEYISVSDKALSLEQVTDYIDRTLQPKLEALPGVADIVVFGGKTYAMRIWLNPILMAAHKVTAGDVQTALFSNNMRSTAGVLKGNSLLFNVSVNSDVSSAAAFNNIVVKKVGNQYVRIKDIGRAVLGAVTQKIVATDVGKKVSVIEVVPKERADSIQVANKIGRELKQLKPSLPPGMVTKILLDKTVFSRASIHEVHVTLIEACILVFIIIFLFLGSLRLLLVPIATIPLSLLGGFAIMWFSGYSLNSLTFLAFILAIGLVVDDAIVVIENVHRHILQGETPILAAEKGIFEIYNAVISMTLTVAIVLAPIGFVPGYSGALFKQFAFALAYVVLISGVLALFVSPAMSAALLKNANHHTNFSHKLDAIFSKVCKVYQVLLKQILAWRIGLAVVFVCVIIFGLFVARQIPSELMPNEDMGFLNAIAIASSGMNLEYSERQGKLLEKLFKHSSYMSTYGVFYGFPNSPTSVIGFIGLKQKYMNKENEILGELNAELQKIPTLMAFGIKTPTSPGEIDLQPIAFVIKTSKDYGFLNAAAQKLLVGSLKYPGISHAQITLKMNQVNVNVKINKDKANALGVPISEISNTLTEMLGEPITNYFGLDNRSYEVIPQVYKHFRMNPSDIKHFYVKTLSGKLIPLSNVVRISLSMAPNSLNQFQQMHSTQLTASVAPGYALGQALTYLEHYTSTHLPKAIQYDFAGQSRQFFQTQGKLMDAFVVAILLIYLLLTVNFTSFRDPLLVMICVPLSLVGAVYAIYMSGATFNIYTKIGLIMLIGLISKHGILIVNFANQLQAQGASRVEAAIQAATIRLRPVLMTTLAMIFGAIPLVFANGAGHLARQQIGWVIIGGMAFGTCLTLFVVPIAYAVFAREIQKRKVL